MKALKGWESWKTHLQEGWATPQVRELVGVLFFRVLFIGTVVINGFLLAHALGPSDYGRYGYAMSLLQILLVGVNLGFPIVVMRETGKALHLGNWGEIKGLRRFVGGWDIGIGGFAVGILMWIQAHFPDPYGRFHALALLSPFLALAALEALQIFTLKGLRRVVVAYIPFTGFLYTIGLLGAYVWAHTLTIPRVATLLLGSYLIGIFLLQFFVRTTFPEAYHRVTAQYAIRTWLASALPIFLAGSMFALNAQVDVVMLGWFRDNTEVGIYRLASRLAGFVSFPLFVANASIAPRIVSYFMRGEMEELSRWVRPMIRLAFLGAGLLVLCFLLLGSWILSLAGETYRHGYLVLVLLGMGEMVNVAAGSVGWVLQTTHRERDAAVGVGIALMLNVLLNALLTPRMGMHGTAIATGLSLIGWNVVLTWFVWRRFRIRVGIF